MDLIVSQEKLQESRKKELLKEKKRNIEKEIVALGIIIVIISTLIIGYNMFGSKIEEARNNCMAQGYSESYCLKHS